MIEEQKITEPENQEINKEIKEANWGDDDIELDDDLINSGQNSENGEKD